MMPRRRWRATFRRQREAASHLNECDDDDDQEQRWLRFEAARHKNGNCFACTSGVCHLTSAFGTRKTQRGHTRLHYYSSVYATQPLPPPPPFAPSPMRQGRVARSRMCAPCEESANGTMRRCLARHPSAHNCGASACAPGRDTRQSVCAPVGAFGVSGARERAALRRKKGVAISFCFSVVSGVTSWLAGGRNRSARVPFTCHLLGKALLCMCVHVHAGARVSVPTVFVYYARAAAREIHKRTWWRRQQTRGARGSQIARPARKVPLGDDDDDGLSC